MIPFDEIEEKEVITEEKIVETCPAEPTDGPRKRGRPRGVKESAPRNRRPNTEKILSHLQEATQRLEAL